MRKLERCWINQPSTTQPLHRLHGTNVIADITAEGKACDVYFTKGMTISMIVPKLYLSRGWTGNQNR